MSRQTPRVIPLPGGGRRLEVDCPWLRCTIEFDRDGRIIGQDVRIREPPPIPDANNPEKHMGCQRGCG